MGVGLVITFQWHKEYCHQGIIKYCRDYEQNKFHPLKCSCSCTNSLKIPTKKKVNDKDYSCAAKCNQCRGVTGILEKGRPSKI